ncbi:transcriptional regulator [Paenibacillus sp. FSL A5-0031]|uniref:BlaI/MecI/CopY family transcriptional regulator n=1 Tax=Paenibacillus sp. FSL A5-0031 TaxID=1920420 RepID=UPI00096CCF5B|nr:BlaI/MecI/CopY family transcriptional regulator [Paenibacillus sp. FSL A5-0031]OME75949.1 transcriptional regulator [Paenibacillus sp. FSL A5-0031]
MKIKKLNLHEEGLSRFFGSLEVKVMNIMWEKEKLTIKQAHEIINNENPISINAVMTVIIRLAEKGHLYKETSGGGRNRLTFFYPVQSKDQFIMEQTKVVTNGLIEDFGSVIVNHFIDSLDGADPELIQTLQNRINEIKSK